MGVVEICSFGLHESNPLLSDMFFVRENMHSVTGKMGIAAIIRHTGLHHDRAIKYDLCYPPRDVTQLFPVQPKKIDHYLFISFIGRGREMGGRLDFQIISG